MFLVFYTFILPYALVVTYMYCIVFTWGWPTLAKTCSECNYVIICKGIFGCYRGKVLVFYVNYQPNNGSFVFGIFVFLIVTHSEILPLSVLVECADEYVWCVQVCIVVRIKNTEKDQTFELLIMTMWQCTKGVLNIIT
jgi:hypothetical protein